jgi:hypothetical protein
MKDQNLVTVGTFPDVSLAYLAKGRLAEAGITCFIAEENASGVLLGVGVSWPKLQVAEEDAVRAIAVLESQFGPEEEEAEDQPPEGAITARDQFARFHDVEEPEAEENAPWKEEEQPATGPLENPPPDFRSAGQVLIWLVLAIIVGPLVLGVLALLLRPFAGLFR